METLKDQLEKIKNTLHLKKSKQCIEKDNNYAECPRCHKYIRKLYLVDHIELNHNENTVSKRKLKAKRKKAKRKKGKWIKKACTSCKENIYYLPEWKSKPKFCKKCSEKKFSNKVKGRYARVSFSRLSGYSVQGGSPGLGKKR